MVSEQNKFNSFRANNACSFTPQSGKMGNRRYRSSQWIPVSDKTLLYAMRLTVFFILCLSISATATGYSQNVTLAEKNVSLDKVFNSIEKQTGYVFFYSYQLLKSAKKVTLDVRSRPLQEVLTICFKDQPLDFVIEDKTITITKKPEPAKPDNNLPPQPPPPVTISGRVTNENGEPVAVNILVKGSGNGTASGADGYYYLQNVDADATLVVTGIGIEAVEIKVNGRSHIDIRVMTRVSGMEEVIVRKGYYDEKKATTTGNVSTVTAKDIEKQPVSNPLLALEGRVPGMLVTQSNGLPGSAVTIQIRGQNSISNGNDPLYIVDGVPYTSQNIPFGINNVLGNSGTNGQFTGGSPFSYLNPADIESIDVLKDADATAIYGSRGANGVVLITTKKGKSGATRVDVNIQSGWGKVAKKMQLLNTRQYLDMRYEAFKNNNVEPNPNADYDLTLWDTTRNTDWQKELIGGTAKYNDVEASAYGGNTNTQYLIGAGYHKETTVFPADFYDQKGSVHFNITNSSPNKKFKVLLSGVYTVDNNLLSGYDLTEQALKLPPNAPPMYNPDGSLNWATNAAGVSTWQNSNPAAMLLLGYKTVTNNLVANAAVSYEVLPNLLLKTNFGYTNMQVNGTQTIPLEVNAPSTWSTVQRSTIFANGNIHSWIIEPQASYNRRIKKGELTILAGSTIQQNSNTGQEIEASGFNSDLVMEDIAAATTIIPRNRANSVYKYAAAFTRLNFNWDDKYIINLTGRRDGSSRFGPASQFHNFGATGLGWIFSREPFISKALPILSLGKIRASYGTTGNDQVGDYTFMDLYSSSGNTGVPYLGVIGISPGRIFTPDLAWEETRKLEAGLELGFLKDRIYFTGSFYRNRSSNQLLAYSLPSITGFTSIQKNLDALVQNQGWEFELRTENVQGRDFHWTSSFNISMNRNKLVSGAPGLTAYYQDRIGHPLFSQFVYHFTGVDILTGLYQVADNQGNATTSPNPLTDATVLIDRTPKYYGGLQNNISYKGIQLDFIFQFIKQPASLQYLYNYIPGFFTSNSGSNQPVTVLNRWQQPGDVKPIQKFSQDYSVYNSWNIAQQSDQAYADGSYIRLKNMSISWQLPSQWKRILQLQNARIYAQGQNLLTFTKYQGLDPESKSSTRLPPLRVITLGIQATL